MAAPQPPPPPRGGLSLYENLHDPNDPTPSSATISSAPVLYNSSSATPSASVKKPLDPALRFQPTRRPQPPKPKSKSAFPKSIPKPSSAAAPAPGPPPPPPPPPEPTGHVTAAAAAAAPAKSTLADWAANEEDEWMYGTGEKRQRGGRKAKKKRQQQYEQMETDWDDIYDPSRPTNVDEYLKSDEKVDEVREWKALLYRHRKGKAPESDLSSDEDERIDMRPNNQFAPPPSYAAVPPPPASPPSTAAPPPPPPPPDDASGEDAYARRLALSSSQLPPPPPPPPTSSTTISAAPIRYNTQPSSRSPSPPPSTTSAAADEPRSSRPGQAGFAHRLMAKYGWTSGAGLGASSSGIVNPLRVQVEKRRKKADADGGGWAEPGGKGKIIGGGKRQGEEEQGLSDVIVLLNMLDNMPDLAREVEDGLGQEIGEECGEKYGRVERVYIDTATQRVFIKFTDQISALKAVSELQGRVFNGNTITPKYYNSDAFDKGVYTK